MVDDRSQKSTGVALRQAPYPYKAMMAICSDLDETPNREVYYQSMKYLNTTESTIMGKGVGLEVGNTIYFDMPDDQFSYWNTDELGRETVRQLIRSGHVDCLHSFGDFADSREKVTKALTELKAHDCHIKVWIDHAVAPSNFGPDIMMGQGDVRDSQVYHADMTAAYGVEYVWMGRVTSVIGQGVKPSLKGIWRASHPLASFRTVAKEFLKRLLAKRGQAKYAMHQSNELLCPVRLRDGTKMYEFMRSNPFWGGVSAADNAAGIAEVLTTPMLDRLVERGGTCILYTHLGKISDVWEPFGASSRKAFELLSQYAKDRKILVTTTRRILDYHRSVQEIDVDSVWCGDVLRVNLTTDRREEELAGVTLHVPAGREVQVRLNGEICEGIQRNAKDESGRESISFPWNRLKFPLL